MTFDISGVLKILRLRTKLVRAQRWRKRAQLAFVELKQLENLVKSDHMRLLRTKERVHELKESVQSVRQRDDLRAVNHRVRLWERNMNSDFARLERRQRKLSSHIRRSERLLSKERAFWEGALSAHFMLAIAVRLLSLSERDRYLEEFRAELLDIPPNTRLSHALSLLRGVLVLRLRRGLKNKAADAAVRRVKG